jgi:hypothetical protein
VVHAVERVQEGRKRRLISGVADPGAAHGADVL